MNNELLQVPDWPRPASEDYPFGLDLMSNIEDEIDADVARRLQDEQVLAGYSGWNFHATCWFADGEYHAAVYCYHVHRATISAATPRELKLAVSDEFGYD